MTRKDLMEKAETSVTIINDKELRNCEWISVDNVNKYLDERAAAIERTISELKDYKY